MFGEERRDARDGGVGRGIGGVHERVLLRGHGVLVLFLGPIIYSLINKFGI